MTRKLAPLVPLFQSWCPRHRLAQAVVLDIMMPDTIPQTDNRRVTNPNMERARNSDSDATRTLKCVTGVPPHDSDRISSRAPVPV